MLTSKQAADIIKGIGAFNPEEVAPPPTTDGFMKWLVLFLHL